MNGFHNVERRLTLKSTYWIPFIYSRRRGKTNLSCWVQCSDYLSGLEEGGDLRAQGVLLKTDNIVSLLSAGTGGGSICENSTNCTYTYLLIKSALLTNTVWLFCIQSIKKQRPKCTIFYYNASSYFLRQLHLPIWYHSLPISYVSLFSSIFNFSFYSHFTFSTN